ncbi:MAG: pyridoxamine 5'-phosphate oxidase [Flammeovirgaceae bacterium]
MDLKDIRRDYIKQELLEAHVLDDPIAQFKRWLQEAITSEVAEATAMTLATATPTGKPSARIVLLKTVEEGGFVFFTNYESQKGKELAENPQACLNFYWIELERQVRIEGIVEKVSDADSASYFLSRPTGSQIGAIASPQSERIPNRTFLEEKVESIQAEYEQKQQLERPMYWGGYRVIPNYIEFWQGRASRLHDRIIYEKVGDTWKIARLAP